MGHGQQNKDYASMGPDNQSDVPADRQFSLAVFLIFCLFAVMSASVFIPKIKDFLR